jgi:peptidoglycan-associated lipoprotein
MKYFLSVASLALVLTACGSSVKLDTVPVEDKSAVAVAAGAATAGGDAAKAGAVSGGTATGGATSAGGTSGDAVAKSTVAAVDLSKQSAAADALVRAKAIYFDYDSIVIKPEFQAALEAHARFLRAEKSRRVAIEGHTDERGGREYNLALGQKRAEAVRSALGLLGVADAQVEAVSFGKEKPAAQGSDEASLAKNRRAELNYR